MANAAMGKTGESAEIRKATSAISEANAKLGKRLEALEHLVMNQKQE
jgi:hypothetical protein